MSQSSPNAPSRDKYEKDAREFGEPVSGCSMLVDFPALSWRMNRLGQHDYFNKTWLAFTGSTLEHETGGGWMDHIHPEDLDAYREKLNQSFKNRIPFETRFRLLRSDGHWRWITDLGRPFRDARGEFAGLIGCSFDITERIEQEALLAEAKSRAEAAGEAKSRFLANISHEVRTPLNGIMGMLEALAESSPTAEQTEYIETASESARQLLGLLNDLLDLARIEADNLPLHPSPLNVGELIRRGAAPFAHEARSLGITLAMDVCPKLDSLLFPLDEVRMRQLVFNLLGNALKFTKFGGRVDVCAFLAGSAHAPRLVVLVSDTGIGIPGDKLAAIFDPFVQAREALTRTHDGAGLGLSIVRKLVLMMGGSVCVGSEPGLGTDFAFSIPVAPGQAAPARTQAAPPMPRVALLPLPPLRALLVEDDRVSQITARRMLEKLGMSVSVAENGRQALDALDTLAASGFDIVFMDLQMPEMDGLTATRAIRERERTAGTPRLPVVAMTAHAMKGDREMCLDAGMDEYVSKPLERSALALAARAALDKVRG
jgi:PAS domain S-box-containing protein